MIRLSANRLSHEDRRELISLLRLLKVHLTSAIESAIVPGTKTAMPEDKVNVRADRHDIRVATRWITRLKLPNGSRIPNPQRAATPGRRKRTKAKENPS